MRIGRTRLIVALTLGLLACSLSVAGQQPTKVPRVGILSDESHLVAAKTFEPFAEGLRALGYIEGQNIAFERRYAEGENEILPDLAAELVRLQPDVILAIGQENAFPWIERDLGIEFGKWDLPIVDEVTTVVATWRAKARALQLPGSEVQAMERVFAV